MYHYGHNGRIIKIEHHSLIPSKKQKQPNVRISKLLYNMHIQSNYLNIYHTSTCRIRDQIDKKRQKNPEETN